MKRVIKNKKKMKNTMYIVFGTFALLLFMITRTNPSFANEGLIIDEALDKIAEQTIPSDNVSGEDSEVSDESIEGEDPTEPEIVPEEKVAEGDENSQDLENDEDDNGGSEENLDGEEVDNGENDEDGDKEGKTEESEKTSETEEVDNQTEVETPEAPSDGESHGADNKLSEGMESSIIDNEEEIEKGDGVEIGFLNKMDNELKVMETPETFTISFNTDGGTQINPIHVESGTILGEKRISKTSNVSDDGDVRYLYQKIEDTNDVVTISGAKKLYITIKYQGSYNSWLSIWPGNHPEYKASVNYSTSVVGKLSGDNRDSVNNVLVYELDGDTVTFSFGSSDSSTYYYRKGYYAEIEGIFDDVDVIPTKQGYIFKGWYKDENLTEKFYRENPIDKNISLYPRWKTDCLDYVFLNENNGVSVKRNNGCGKSIDFSNGLDGYDVISIEEYAFAFDGIESVNLGNKIEKIGNCAFCYNDIVELELPSTINEIGNSAFTDNKIEYINFPVGLEKIGDSAFRNNKLISIEIPTSVVSIGAMEDPNGLNGAFSDNNISSLILNSGLKLIGNNSFKNNEIEILEVPSTVEVIGESAFQSNNINSLTLLNSGVSIGKNAFAYNNIPEEDAFAFDVIDGLRTLVSYGGNNKRIIIPEGTEAVADNVFKGLGIEYVELNTGLKVIGDNAFANNNLQELTIPGTVEEIGDCAFNQDTRFDKLSFNGDPGEIFYGYSVFGSYYEAEDDTFKYLLADKKFIYSYKGSSPTVVIPEGVVGIYSYAFQSRGITEVQLPSTLKTVGKYAFQSDNITNLVLPDSLLYVGDWGFGSNQLESLTFGNSLKKIGDYAFYGYGCRLTSVNMPDTVTFIGDYGFANCPISDLHLSTSLKYIGEYGFYQNNLTELYIPESVESMGKYYIFQSRDPNSLKKVNAQGGGVIYQSTFGFDNTITELETGPGVREIGDRAFMSKKIEKITLGSGLKSIGEYAFQSTPLSGEVIIPDTVTNLGRGVFNGSKVTSIIVGLGIKVLPYMVFEGYSSQKVLENVTLPEGLEEIGEYALAYTNISSIKLPSTLKKIGANAFVGTTNLREVVLPEGFESFGESAFCDSNRGLNVKAYITENPNETLLQQASGACVDLVRAYRVKYRSEIETHQEIIEDEIVEENKTAHQPFSLDNIEGYTFGRYKEGENIPFDFTNPITGDMELIAKYIKNKYKITYLEDNLQKIDEKIIEFEDDIPMPSLTKEGYTFRGWSGITENGKVPAYDIILIAQWEINQYKIIFDTDGGTAINPIDANYNSVIPSLPTSTKECNAFSGWDIEIPERMPAHDIILKAVWNYTCSRSSGAGGRKTETTTREIAIDTNTENEHNSADEKENNTEVSEENKTILNDETSNQVISVTQEVSEDGTVEAVVETVKIRNTDIIATVRTEVNPSDSSSSSSSSTTHTKEQKDAYSFAKSNGITTTKSIETAKMDTELTRIQMAKMVSNYAINVLGQEPDTSKGTVEFKDVTEEMDKQYDNAVTKAYQLGIMGQNVNDNKFRPNDEVSRAEFSATLSRLLYHTEEGKYRGTGKYYVPHIAKLYNEGIINKVIPTMKERRGYVMTMLMRTVK